MNENTTITKNNISYIDSIQKLLKANDINLPLFALKTIIRWINEYDYKIMNVDFEEGTITEKDIQLHHVTTLTIENWLIIWADTIYEEKLFDDIPFEEVKFRFNVVKEVYDSLNKQLDYTIWNNMCESTGHTEMKKIDNENKIKIVTNLLQEALKVMEIPLNESTKNTPKRIAKMWVNELFANVNNANIQQLNSNITLFDNPSKESDLIILRDIKFNSTCEHHFLPFSGVVDVAYLPKNKILGLSKIPRIVKYFSKKPQLQERLTKNIGEYIMKVADPYFILVRIKATHGCVMCRGIESDCSTDTIFVQAYNSIDTNYYKQQYYLRVGGNN